MQKLLRKQSRKFVLLLVVSALVLGILRLNQHPVVMPHLPALSIATGVGFLGVGILHLPSALALAGLEIVLAGCHLLEAVLIVTHAYHHFPMTAVVAALALVGLSVYGLSELLHGDEQRESHRGRPGG